METVESDAVLWRLKSYRDIIIIIIIKWAIKGVQW